MSLSMINSELKKIPFNIVTMSSATRPNLTTFYGDSRDHCEEMA